MSGLPRIGRGWQYAALLGVLAIGGCGPGFAPLGVDIVVRAPPPGRVEVRGGPPGSAYVWINGHYAWQGGDYLWISGRWEAPPQPTYRRWEPGRWVHARQGWYWVEGRWR